MSGVAGAAFLATLLILPGQRPLRIALAAALAGLLLWSGQRAMRVARAAPAFQTPTLATALATTLPLLIIGVFLPLSQLLLALGRAEPVPLLPALHLTLMLGMTGVWFVMSRRPRP